MTQKICNHLHNMYGFTPTDTTMEKQLSPTITMIVHKESIRLLTYTAPVYLRNEEGRSMKIGNNNMLDSIETAIKFFHS